MKLSYVLMICSSYYEVYDIKGNLLFTRDHRNFKYDNAFVYNLIHGEGFDGRPCLKIRVWMDDVKV